MRRLLMVLMSISLWPSFAVVSRASQPAPPAACPATTQVESTAIARAWHDDVVNRRNPTMLSDILGPEVVHHAAGGYPKIMNAEGIAAMMGDFLAAFPDLHLRSVHREGRLCCGALHGKRNASGTARRFETHQPYGHLDRHKYIPHYLRAHCRSLVRG